MGVRDAPEHLLTVNDWAYIHAYCGDARSFAEMDEYFDVSRYHSRRIIHNVLDKLGFYNEHELCVWYHIKFYGDN